MNEQSQYAWPNKSLGSGSIEDDIASENTTSKKVSDESHPPQVSHYQSLLSRDEITAILDALSPNGERLSEEDVQCSILQLIIADQEWWTNSGTTAFKSIRQLVEGNPRTELAKAISSLMLKVAEELLESIQNNDTVSYLIWAEMLDIGLPTSSRVKIWIAILNRLSQVEYNLAYERWWRGQGKDVISNLCLLVSKNSQSALADTLASFTQESTMKVQNALQEHNLNSLSLSLDVLVTSVSLASGGTVWTDLVEKLSKVIPVPVYEIYSWELRSLLLQVWGNIPSLQNSPLIHSWLEVRWNELGKFLALNLPDRWRKIAITSLLNVPLDIPPRHVIDSMIGHERLFEKVLQELMETRTPTSQKGAMDFFATLAENGYGGKVKLLGGMLLAIVNEQKNMERLLDAACLEPREVKIFLENHCQQILSEYPLSPALLEFIRQYLSDFTIYDLDHSPAKELLRHLQRRNEKPGLRLPADLRAYVQGWYSIAEFINHSTISKLWLRNVSAMPPLTPDQQIQLTTTLVPHLVKLVSTEADLCRVLDNLAPVLMGSGTGSIDPGLLLLEYMIGPVVEMYKQDRLLIRLIPYINIVLGETHHLLLPKEKEEHLYRCLPSLLEWMDVETLTTLNAYAAQWLPTIQFEEWKAYLVSSGLLPRVDVAAPAKRVDAVSTLPAEEKPQPIAAMVNEQHIYLEIFHKLCYVKAMYLQYDDYVQQRNGNHASRKKEGQTLTDTQWIQKSTLEDLIDDVLIRENIDELGKKDSSLSTRFDPTRQLHPISQDFKIFCGTSYVAWLRDSKLEDKDVDFALRLFIRRELFDLDLQQTQRKSLSNWLIERKRRAKIVRFV